MSFFLFSHDTPPTALYTFSLHDALPISPAVGHRPDGLQTRREVGVVWYRNTPAHVVVQRLPCSHRREGLRSQRSEEHTSELQSPYDLVCRLLLEKKNTSLDQAIRTLVCD